MEKKFVVKDLPCCWESEMDGLWDLHQDELLQNKFAEMWFRRFGITEFEFTHYDQSGPCYDVYGSRTNLARMLTHWERASLPGFDDGKDYGIDLDLIWYMVEEDWIKEV